MLPILHFSVTLRVDTLIKEETKPQSSPPHPTSFPLHSAAMPKSRDHEMLGKKTKNPIEIFSLLFPFLGAFSLLNSSSLRFFPLPRSNEAFSRGGADELLLFWEKAKMKEKKERCVTTHFHEYEMRNVTLGTTSSRKHFKLRIQRWFHARSN